MVGRPSRTKDSSQRGRIPPEAQRYLNRWLAFSQTVLIGFPMVAVGIYCVNLQVDGWAAFGAAVMVSGASFLVGALLGFLFGIPRALSSDARGEPAEQGRLATNTNLEQVSDWLTKIIVGATLVQLGSLTRRLGELAKYVSTIFGAPSAQNQVMAGAIIIYAAAFGFFATYISARSILTFIFYISPSDWLPGRQDAEPKRGADNGEES